MGDPRQQRKKYDTPRHPWKQERIDEEKELTKEFGFKNKKEIWKTKSILKKFTIQAKTLTGETTEQSEKEKKVLLNKLIKLNLIKTGSDLDDILSLKTRDIAERRLQTIVFKKRFARSPKQARQFITHGHIKINNKKITIPSYIVNNDEESKISFDEVSNLAKVDHPERVQPKKEEVKEKPKKETKEKVKKEKPKEKKEAKKIVKEEKKTK